MNAGYLGKAGFAYRDLWNIACGEVHSALMPAALITLAHFSVSSAMSLPKSAGDPGRRRHGLAAASTRPVATKKPNMWGIYDMRGNVAEWVQDFYDPNYYSISPLADPKGPPAGEGHVVRGGSFHVYPWLTRVSLRTMFPETYKFDDIGFRVVREVR